MVNYRLVSAEDHDAIRTFLRAEDQYSPVAAGALQHLDLVAWVAVAGDALVAVVLTRPMVFDDGTLRGGVDELVVDSSRRNQGIGRRLMELAEAHYQADGAVGMRLGTREDNARARRLYEKLGYTATQVRLRMEKDF